MSEKVLADKIKEKSNVEVLYNSEVKELLGDDELKGIVLSDGKKIDIEGMFISIGMKPQTEILNGVIDLTNYNYVDSDDCTTNNSSIFVAGDCRDKKVRQLTTAVSDGAIAATSVIKYLENN